MNAARELVTAFAWGASYINTTQNLEGGQPA